MSLYAMPDLLDQAEVASNLFLQEALSKVKAPERKLHSHCLNCQTPLPSPGAYCDPDCQADHEIELAAKRRNGYGDA